MIIIILVDINIFLIPFDSRSIDVLTEGADSAARRWFAVTVVIVAFVIFILLCHYFTFVRFGLFLSYLFL
jgi:hypothetical protein